MADEVYAHGFRTVSPAFTGMKCEAYEDDTQHFPSEKTALQSFAYAQINASQRNINDLCYLVRNNLIIPYNLDIRKNRTVSKSLPKNL